MSNYIKLFFVFISSCGLCTDSLAQDSMKEGYIIDYLGDTISGLIKDEQWTTTPKNIQFKTDTDDAEQLYSYRDIQGFGIKTDKYIATPVVVEFSAENPSGTIWNIRTDSIFLKVLREGVKSLYLYKESVQKDNFYIQIDGEYHLLVMRQYYVKSDGNSPKTTLREDKKYIGQLEVYFNDCPRIEKKLNKTSYTQESLEKLFDNYDRCVN